MKKIFFLILILFLVGCEKETTKFYLDDEYYNTNLIQEVDSETINNNINNESSFAIFIHTPGCTSCQEFEVYLNEFVNDYPISFLKTTIEEAKKTNISKNVKYTPSVVLYHDGKLVSYLDATSNDDLKYYSSKDEFKVWLEKYIYLEK